MTYIRAFVWSIVGFIIPTVLAVLILPQFFSNSVAPDSYYNKIFKPPGTGSSQALALVKSADEVQLQPFDTNTQDYQRVSPLESIDPAQGVGFVAQVTFRFQHLPTVGKRQRIVFKYDIDRKPYPGWALAMNNLSTSVRPEVYWQGEGGNGGWYNFNEVALAAGKWYTVSLIALNGSFVSLYLEQPKFDPGAGEAERPKSKLRFDKPEQEIIFVGGIDIAEVEIPKTDSDLYVATPKESLSGGKIEIAEIIVAHPDELPDSREEVLEFLAGGIDQLKPDEIVLRFNKVSENNTVANSE